MNDLLIKGSSKDFYATNNSNEMLVIFKDLVHGRGKVQTIKGTGRLREEFCYYFYKFLEKQGIPTHLVKGNALQEKGILVQKMNMIPLELISRYVSRGHWVDAHKFPLLPAGVEFDTPIIEFCVKWKDKTNYLPFEQLTKTQKISHSLLKKIVPNIVLPSYEIKDDPRVNYDMIIALDKYAKDNHLKGKLIKNKDEYEELYILTKKVNQYLAEFLKSQNWILEDGKFEAGILPNDSTRKIIVADEYTQDSSRVRDKNGNSLTKDLFRQEKPQQQIYDSYAQLTEAMKNYAK